MTTSVEPISPPTFYTLRQFFADNTHINEDHQLQLITSINEMKSKISNGVFLDQLSTNNRCTEFYKNSCYAFGRKSSLKTPYSILKTSEDRFYIPLKLKFKQKRLIFFQKTVNLSHKGTTPTLDLTSAEDPLDMKIVGLEKIRINKKTREKDVARFNKEVANFRTRQHSSHTIKLIDSFELVDNQVGVLRDWCPVILGTKVEDKQLSTEMKRILYAKSIIDILVKLHISDPSMHDVEIENDLFDSIQKLTINNLGLDSIPDEFVNATTLTPGILAPEYIVGIQMIKEGTKSLKKAKTDVDKKLANGKIFAGTMMSENIKRYIWAAGVVIYTRINQKNPFITPLKNSFDGTGLPINLAYLNYVRDNEDEFRKTIDNLFSKNPSVNTLEWILKNMLDTNPDTRLSLERCQIAIANLINHQNKIDNEKADTSLQDSLTTLKSDDNPYKLPFDEEYKKLMWDHVKKSLGKRPSTKKIHELLHEAHAYEANIHERVKYLLGDHPPRARVESLLKSICFATQTDNYGNPAETVSNLTRTFSDDLSTQIKKNILEKYPEFSQAASSSPISNTPPEPSSSSSTSEKSRSISTSSSSSDDAERAIDLEMASSPDSSPKSGRKIAPHPVSISTSSISLEPPLSLKASPDSILRSSVSSDAEESDDD